MKVQTRRYNQVAINKLREKYALSAVFIRQCLNGTRQSITADTIKKEYKELVDKIDKL